jgi:hypothetical protein
MKEWSNDTIIIGRGKSNYPRNFWSTLNTFPPKIPECTALGFKRDLCDEKPTIIRLSCGMATCQ